MSNTIETGKVRLKQFKIDYYQDHFDYVLQKQVLVNLGYGDDTYEETWVDMENFKK